MPTRFVTLGPSGTNHEFVTRKYMDFQGLHRATLSFAGSMDEAVGSVRGGTADYFVICAVHPQTARAVGRFFREVFIVDTFVSPSLPLAILTRREIAQPRSIGVLHPSTTDYVDSAEWERITHVNIGTLHDVAGALLGGVYDSGIVYRHYAERFPDRLRVDRDLGSPDDAWLVLGQQRTYSEPIQAWHDSPITRQFRERQDTLNSALYLSS